MATLPPSVKEKMRKIAEKIRREKEKGSLADRYHKKIFHEDTERDSKGDGWINQYKGIP